MLTCDKLTADDDDSDLKRQIIGPKFELKCLNT